MFGLDADLLAFVPQPAVALQLLFPSAEYKSAKPEVADDAKLKPDELFYLDQVSALPNACGTIALIHGIANNMEMLGVAVFCLLLSFSVLSFRFLFSIWNLKQQKKQYKFL